MTDLPLPERSGVTFTYDNPDSDRDDEAEMRVSRRADGSFYGDNGRFDWTALDADSARAKLCKWGYTRHSS